MFVLSPCWKINIGAAGSHSIGFLENKMPLIGFPEETLQNINRAEYETEMNTESQKEGIPKEESYPINQFIGLIKTGCSEYNTHCDSLELDAIKRALDNINLKRIYEYDYNYIIPMEDKSKI